ncbi:hypothetical protein A6R68_24136, partial [Neotoma lepida]
MLKCGSGPVLNGEKTLNSCGQDEGDYGDAEGEGSTEGEESNDGWMRRKLENSFKRKIWRRHCNQMHTTQSRRGKTQSEKHQDRKLKSPSSKRETSQDTKRISSRGRYYSRNAGMYRKCGGFPQGRSSVRWLCEELLLNDCPAGCRWIFRRTVKQL